MSGPGAVEWEGPPPHDRGRVRIVWTLQGLALLVAAAAWALALADDDPPLPGLLAPPVVLALGLVVGLREWRRRGVGTRVIAAPTGLTVRPPGRRDTEDLPWDRITGFVVDDAAFFGVEPGLLSAELTDGSRRFVGLPEGHEGLLRYWQTVRRDGTGEPPASAGPAGQAPGS